MRNSFRFAHLALVANDLGYKTICNELIQFNVSYPLCVTFSYPQILLVSLWIGIVEYANYAFC